jgi:hypothetical protein
MQRLANELRALVKETIPNASEAVYTGWKLIGYRVREDRRDAYFCFIAPLPNRIMLGFEYGIQLFDPNLRLEGDGTQVRYLTVSEKEDIEPEIFRAFIAEAAQIALQRKLSKQQKPCKDMFPQGFCCYCLFSSGSSLVFSFTPNSSNNLSRISGAARMLCGLIGSENP